MKKLVSILLALIFVVSCFALQASASSAGMGGSLNGDTATFTLTVSDGAGVGGFEGDFSVTGGSIVSVSGGSMSAINGSRYNLVMNSATSSATMTIVCKMTGDSITLSTGNIGVVNDNGDFIGSATASKTLTRPAETTTAPKETTTQNPDANLRSMSVEGYTLSPAFNQWTTEYTITVPKDTKSINLSATPLKADSTVSGTGLLNISKLPQTFSIVCKASNGTTKTYHLTVKAPTEIGLTKLEVYALAALDPAFDPAVFEYTATVPFGTKSVDVKALFDDEQFKDAKIDVKGADDLEKSKDTVTVTITAADGTETVYTIHIKYADEIVDQVTETVVKNRIPLWVVIVFLLLVVAFSIVSFFLGKRNERSSYEAYKKYYGNDDDDDIDDDDNGPSIFGGFDQSAD
ncbi:MAG: cadherin-like beta sandwich domain-containing protein [Oscillospiraceae bacterium]|nr:cadherin-like beta sandwich domain-containing protein [Candidatus Limimonas egerieequi]